MDLLFTRNAAARSLKAAPYDPKKLALIHGAVAMGLPLIATALNFLLQQNIAGTSGLSGIGIRSVLASLQMLLSMAVNILLPFWEIGFLRAALGMARQEQVQPRTLTQGFRRLWPVLRLMILQTLLFTGIAILCSYAATTLYLLSPLSSGMMTVMEQFPMDTLTPENTDAMLAAMLPHLIPMYALVGIAFFAISTPVFYSLRMAQFAIMDDPMPRARQAMGISRRLMKGNRLSLFKLDLRFWWFYAAHLLLAAVASLDFILPALGVTLPINADTAYFLFYCIYLILQLLLTWQCQSYIQTTYACCYHVLKQAANIPAEQFPRIAPND